jgi:hypothetical protein
MCCTCCHQPKYYMKKLLLLCACLGSAATTFAQLTIGAQLRTRTEFRDGYNAPLPDNTNPAFFTSQRTRLFAGFSGYRFKLGFTLQDVRVWGQDVSTINRTTSQDYNGLMVHEAWAEILLTDTIVKNKTLSLKIGRQELVYDDSRLLGNLDWAQQARRFDAAVLKYETSVWKLHVAGAFNQNKENLSTATYNETPPASYTANTNGGLNYKGLEFVYASRQFKKGNLSFLFLADQFSKFHTDSLNNKIWDQGTNNRMTTGLYFINTFNRFTVNASGYYQFGHNTTAQSLSAGLLSGNFQAAITNAFSAGLGVDYTTGGKKNGTDHAFDPLYGTAHKFWGYMDYFYVNSGFGNTGLQDYYFKARLKANSKCSLSLDVHQFYGASDVAGSTSRKFGTEADVVATYALTKVIGFEAGYSHFWNTATLTAAAVKNVTNAETNSNWAYVMVIIKPEALIKL